MTIRQSKQFTWVFVGLAVAAAALDAVVAYRHPERLRLSDLVPPLLLLVVFTIMRQHYARLEAEHGPDYVQPVPRRARAILVIGLTVAIVLGVLLIYLLVSGR